MIVIRELSVSYNERRVLGNISMNIPDHQITCIIGPNGAGKTTLLRTIAGHLPYKGSIKVNGMEVSAYPRRRLAKTISLVEPLETIEMLSLTVKETLLTSRYPYTTSFFETWEDTRIVEDAAIRLGIKHLLNRRLSQLSSGELQKVAIASAIIKDTPIILLDEPDTHIDPGSKAELIEIIRGLAGVKEIVFTTHDIVFATLLGEHHVILDEGRLIFTGKTRDLISKKHLVEEVFGTLTRVINIDGKEILVPLYIKPERQEYIHGETSLISADT